MQPTSFGNTCIDAYQECFLDGKRWKHISSKQKRIIFESDHAQRLASKAISFWNSRTTSHLIPYWDEVGILQKLSTSPTLAYFIILTAHGIWKSYCDFTHGLKQWSSKKHLKYVKWEWASAAQATINKNYTKFMPRNQDTNNIAKSLPSSFKSCFPINSFLEISINRSNALIIVKPI